MPLAVAVVIWVGLVLGTAAVELGLQNRQIGRCEASAETAARARCVEEHRSWSKAIGQAVGVGVLAVPLVGRYFVALDRLPDRVRRLGAPVRMPLDQPRVRRRVRLVVTGLVGGFFGGMLLIPVWFATTPADTSLRVVLLAAMGVSWGAFSVCLGAAIYWRLRYDSGSRTR